MTRRPVVLDLFACEGGATAGYQAAGYEVYAVDLDENRLKRNPAEHTLVADALWVLEVLATGASIPFDDGALLNVSDITLVHMSPPCQGYSRGNAGRVTDWPKLIPDCRDRARRLGRPYVIENVKDAAPDMVDPVALCGCMFDLIHLQRLRMFESSWGLKAPRACDHTDHEWVAGAYGGARRNKYEARYVRKGGYVPPDKVVVNSLLGIAHDMTWQGLFESIPPAYTEHIGRQLLEQRQEVAA